MQGASALFYTFFTRFYRTRVEEKIHKRYSLFYIQKNERNSCENEEKESLEKHMCAFLRILHGVFDGSRRCVFCYGVCSRGADDCRKRSGGKSVAGSGERSRQHGRCTEHDKSGKCGADRERRSDGCGAGRCRRTDGRGADRCRSAGGCGTEYGVWGRPEYGAHPDGGGRKPCGLQLYGGTGSGTSDSGDNGQRNA